jgi:orotate phosphoribosyltransferase
VSGITALATAHLRVARPTDDLSAVIRFYRDGLGFAIVGSFTNHDGFDGLMLGHTGASYHLEFTRKVGHAAGKAPTQDNLLVFYLPDPVEWSAAVARMGAAGYAPVPAFNPYWDRLGKTFEDPDGYRVVLQDAPWPGRSDPAHDTRSAGDGSQARDFRALLPARTGHFLLESGHHGDALLDLDALFLRPARLRPAVAALAARLAPHGVEAVCGPLVGGAFVAQAVAGELDAEFYFAERITQGTDSGGVSVGYRLPDSLRPLVRGRRVAVVDDAINAGSAVRATVADLAACGAHPVAVGALVVMGDAADARAGDLGVPLECGCRVPGPVWVPTDCPLCAAGVPLERVGEARRCRGSDRAGVQTARIDHIGLWASDLEAVRAVYETHFGAVAGPKYANPTKGFESYFLTFPGGDVRLEVMRVTGLESRTSARPVAGFAHLAIAVGSEAAVDALATRLRTGGYDIVDGPRRTGDGYYECVVLDPEGNRVEITA